jgi:hypothetical protein
MSKPKGGSGNPQLVLIALSELGPMTNRELVEETGVPAIIMSTILYKLRLWPKRMVRVVGWVDLPCNGANTRPLARYGIGTGTDVQKPPPLGHSLASKRARVHKRKRVTSIFNLGNTDVKYLFPDGNTSGR